MSNDDWNVRLMREQGIAGRIVCAAIGRECYWLLGEFGHE